MFKELDEESEEILKKLYREKEQRQNEIIGINDKFCEAKIIEFLEENGYVKFYGKGISRDLAGGYRVSLSITQVGKMYFESKKKYNKEMENMKSRDWKIAIVSASIGAIIGIIPYIITLIN